MATTVPICMGHGGGGGGGGVILIKAGILCMHGCPCATCGVV